MAKTPQNPLSYVGQGTAGAATVLPSTPFNPQQFFSDIIGEKKAEAMLELKKREDVENHNMAVFDRASRYNKDYGELWAGKIEAKATGILEEFAEIAANATDEGRKLNYSERAHFNQKMGDLQNDIATSKKNQGFVDWVIKQARERTDVKYDQYGIELMMEDVENGTFSPERINTHYLLPERQWTDTQVIKSITPMFGSHTATQDDVNVTRLTAASIAGAWGLANARHSELSRHVNNLRKNGDIADTDEAVQAKKKELFDQAVMSENTRRTRQQQININMPGGRPGASPGSSSASLPPPNESVPTKVRHYDSASEKELEYPAFDRTGVTDMTGGVRIPMGQTMMTVSDIAILPTADSEIQYLTYDRNGKIRMGDDGNPRLGTLEEGQPITNDIMQAHVAHAKYLERGINYNNFRFVPHFIGVGDGNKPITMPLNKDTSANFGTKVKQKEFTWGEDQYNEWWARASLYNKPATKRAQFSKIYPSN